MQDFWHYCHIPKYLSVSILKFFKTKSKIINDEKIQVPDKIISRRVKIKILLLHPLGNNPSFVHEIFYFTKNYWKKKLEKHSLKVVAIKNCPISSSGYAIFKNNLLKVRHFFGLHYFPTVICIIVKKL